MSVRFFKKNGASYTIKTSDYADEFYTEATKDTRGSFICQYIVYRPGPYGYEEITEQTLQKKLYFDLDKNVYLSRRHRTPIFNMTTDKIN